MVEQTYGQKVETTGSYLQGSHFLINGSRRHAAKHVDSLCEVLRLMPLLQKLSKSVLRCLTCRPHKSMWETPALCSTDTTHCVARTSVERVMQAPQRT